MPSSWRCLLSSCAAVWCLRHGRGLAHRRNGHEPANSCGYLPDAFVGGQEAGATGPAPYLCSRKWLMAKEKLSKRTSANPPSVTRPALPANFSTSVCYTSTGARGQVRTGTVSSEDDGKWFEVRKHATLCEYRQPTEHTVRGRRRTNHTTPASSI